MPYLPQPTFHSISALAAAILLATGCHQRLDPEQVLASASRHQTGGDNRAAIIELKNVLQQMPQHAAARVQLGDSYLESGDVLSAEKEFRRARDAGAADATVLPRLATVLLLQQQYDQVLSDFFGQPGLPAAAQAELQALRAYALLGLRRPDDASQQLKAALALQPDNVTARLGTVRMALQSGSLDIAMQSVNTVLASHPGNVEALRLQGDVQRHLGQPDRALASYRQVTRLRPAHLHARLDAAALLAANGRLGAARDELAAAVRIAAGNAAVMYTQALVALQDRQYAAALERLQWILRAAPDHPPSNLLAAVIYLEQNQLPQAELHVRRFRSAQPQHAFAAQLAATIALRSGKASAAVALLEPLLQRHPDDAMLHATAGDAYMQLHAYAQATACFDKAVSLAPASVALRTSLAISQLGLGDNERAMAALEHIVHTPESGAASAPRQRAGVLLVLAHMRAGAPDQALAAVQALEKSVNNPALQNLKGGVMLARKDPEQARRAFEAAAKLQPGYLPALQNLAQLDLLSGQPERARLRYEAALARDNHNADLLAALAALAVQQGQWPQARNWLLRATQAAPDALAPALQLGAVYLATNELPRALALAQKLQASNPNSADALALLARAQATSGDAAGALENLADLARRQPGNAAAQLQLAGVLMTLNRPADALAAVRKALVLQPGHAPALATAVRLLTAQRDWEPALAIARQAQTQTATAPLGYRLEGDIEMAQSRPAPALSLYQRAFNLRPDGPLAISLHRARLANGQRSDAEQGIARWLAEHPKDMPTRLYLASVLVAGGDYRRAIPHYEQVLATDPNHVVALNDLAWTCLQAADRRALAYAEKAYALAPANAAVADTLGWILAQQGQPGRAVPLLKKATDSAPQAGDIRFHYASALLRNGERGEARRQLQQLHADPAYQRRDEVRALMATL